MREVTLRVRHTGEPECEISINYPAVTIQSVSSMTGRGRELRRIIQLSGDPGEIQEYLAEFREADSVIEAKSLSRVGEPQVYVALTVDSKKWDSISERLSKRGIHYRMGTTINDGWERWTVYLNPTEELSEIVESLETAGNKVELVRNVALDDIERPPQIRMAQFLDELSPRQREVLSTAIEMGHYEHGGGVGVEQVADDLDVAPATAWEHLSRAESKVMDELVHHLFV